MARSYLSRRTFQALYEQILTKLQHSYGLDQATTAGKIHQFFGFGDFEPKAYAGETVAAVIAENVKELLMQIPEKEREQVNFGAYLYKKQLEYLKDDKPTLSFQGRAYEYGYARFLGFDNLEAFEKSLAPIVPVFTSQETASHAQVLPPTENWTFYVGAFYSFVSYRVKKFLVAIDYTRPTQEGFPVWTKGFHLVDGNNREDADPLNTLKLEGYALLSGAHLYINMRGINAGAMLQMNIIGICSNRGGAGIEKQKVIACSIQTVSLRDYPVSAEAFLIRTTTEYAGQLQIDEAAYRAHQIEPNLNEKENTALSMYLMIQRRNFWVRYPPVVDLEALEIKHNPVRRYFGRLEGEWRVWNFALRKGRMVQSRLEVGTESPYRAHFYPFIKPEILNEHPDLNKQLAALSLSNELNRDQFCFATYIKSHLTLANYAIFDLGTIRKTGGKDKGYAEGMFVSGGYDENGIIGGYCVMCRETKNRRIDVREMERAEAIAYADSLGLRDMYDGLRDLWRRKTWQSHAQPPESAADSGT